VREDTGTSGMVKIIFETLCNSVQIFSSDLSGLNKSITSCVGESGIR